ncbi:hypothetical protein D3C71_1709200 [compost metagenome]
MREPIVQFLHPLFVMVDSEHLITHLHKLERQTGAKTAEADYDKLLCFHVLSPYPIIIFPSG